MFKLLSLFIKCFTFFVFFCLVLSAICLEDLFKVCLCVCVNYVWYQQIPNKNGILTSTIMTTKNHSFFLSIYNVYSCLCSYVFISIFRSINLSFIVYILLSVYLSDFCFSLSFLSVSRFCSENGITRRCGVDEVALNHIVAECVKHVRKEEKILEY